MAADPLAKELTQRATKYNIIRLAIHDTYLLSKTGVRLMPKAWINPVSWWFASVGYSILCRNTGLTLFFCYIIDCV